jgi:hypothetical protein
LPRQDSGQNEPFEVRDPKVLEIFIPHEHGDNLRKVLRHATLHFCLPDLLPAFAGRPLCDPVGRRTLWRNGHGNLN